MLDQHDDRIIPVTKMMNSKPKLDEVSPCCPALSLVPLQFSTFESSAGRYLPSLPRLGLHHSRARALCGLAGGRG